MWCSRVPAKLRLSVMNRDCTGAFMAPAGGRRAAASGEWV
jgi:hypothetical protein